MRHVHCTMRVFAEVDGRMFLKTFAGVVIFAFALGTVALADPPTVRIQQQAILLDAAAIEVIVTVTCGNGESNAGLVVTVRQGSFEGKGDAVFMSTGARQENSDSTTMYTGLDLWKARRSGICSRPPMCLCSLRIPRISELP